MELVKNSSVLTRFSTYIIFAAVMGALLAPAAPFLSVAGAAEQQDMQAVPSYVNPISGVIEDSGQNPGLGQGMSENLIMDTPATLLIDSEGSVFFTFRIGLVEESADLAIELLGADGQATQTLPYSIVEDLPEDNMRDIRIMIPDGDRDPTLRISLVSIPMGREVICFATFAPAGEAVEVPVAEGLGNADDDAIVIAEAPDEIVGIDDEDRGQVLLFLGIAGGILLVMGAIAGVMMFLRKKNADEGS